VLDAVRGLYRKYLIGEVAERSKALDWNSSNIFTGVRGFESHPLRQIACMPEPACGSPAKATPFAGEVDAAGGLAAETAGRFSQWHRVARIGFSATTSRESRQGRKAAAAAAMSGAGG
jgi:hypothetical protein